MAKRKYAAIYESGGKVYNLGTFDSVSQADRAVNIFTTKKKIKSIF